MIRLRNASVLLHAGSPQIQVAVLQSQILSPADPVGSARRVGVWHLFSKVSCRLRTSISPVPSLGLTVPAGRAATLPRHLNHVLAPQTAGLGQQRFSTLRAEDHLGLAVAIPQIDEDRPSMVAIAIHPAAERGLLSFLRQAKFTARM